MSIQVISNRGCWDNILDPEGATDAGCCAQTVYWISFFVLGLLTAFIPHLIYHLCSCDTPSPKAMQHTVKPIPQPTRPVPTPHKTEKKTSLPPLSISSSRVSAPPTSTKPNLSYTAPYIPSGNMEEQINHLRMIQNVLPKEKPDYVPRRSMPLTWQCVLSIARNPGTVLPKTLRFMTSDFFDDGVVSAVFRLQKGLTTHEFRNVLQAWPLLKAPQEKAKAGSSTPGYAPPPRPSNASINLEGCSHIQLDPSLLIHNSFRSLKLAGCPIPDASTFAAAVYQQKQLHTLSWGLENEWDVGTLRNFASNSPHLNRLEIAISDDKALPFHSQNQLTELTIRVPSLTKKVLENILDNCPKLTQLNIWSAQCDNQAALIEIMKTRKPADLQQATLIQDGPHSQLSPHIEKIHNTTIKTIHVHTAPIFAAAGGSNPSNTTPMAFFALLRRFSRHADHLQLLLKHVSQLPSTHSNFQHLQKLGTILAQTPTVMDFAALEQVFTPFDLAFTDAPTYNNSLEWLLRCALQTCIENHDKREKSPDMDQATPHSWKAHLLGTLLARHRDTFLNSSAIAQQT